MYVFFLLNKCNTQTGDNSSTDYRSKRVFAFLQPESQGFFFLLFPNGCCAFTFEEESFLLISI